MDEIEKMEAALRAAVLAHRIALQARLQSETNGFELRFLCARLGFAAEDLDAIAASPDAAALPPALRERLRQRLAAEATRLARLARAASPGYDINRHIAVRRAIGWAEAAPPRVMPGTPGEKRSGWVLNGRFRRSRGSRRPPPQRPTPEGMPAPLGGG